ncbi:MAG: hypothetical protein R3282_01895, partial [Rhodothermales bacterium]|nr:hypothetical protein [Rhodothermales bacterium]
DEVGTQFGKKLVERQELIEILDLDPDKKTACIFVHMFWDATFFWGDDLFGNYERWFREVIGVAIDNRDLNWIVKIHPANLVKSRRDKHAGTHSELEVMSQLVDELPSHVKVMPADHPVSTFSLFHLIDYCITVRGTVGLEAACFGIPVITGGTGRYDRHGFTRDSETKEEVLATLSDLTSVERLSEHETELARRYAWGVLIARPLTTKCIEFGYEKTENASLTARLTEAGWNGIDQAEDVVQLAQWIRGGAADFLSEPPSSSESIRDKLAQGAAD